jgi:hypothetical protein
MFFVFLWHLSVGESFSRVDILCIFEKKYADEFRLDLEVS